MTIEVVSQQTELRSRRQAENDLRNQTELFGFLDSELKLGKAVKHRLKVLRRVFNAYEKVKEANRAANRVLNDKRKVRAQRAEVVLQFIDHAKQQDANPFEFQGDIDDEVFEAIAVKSQGIENLVTIAGRAVETSLREVQYELADNYNSIFDQMVEVLDDLKPDPAKLTYLEYGNAVDHYEAKRNRFRRANTALSKWGKVHTDLGQVKGSDPLLANFLVNANEVVNEYKRAQKDGEAPDYAQLVKHHGYEDGEELQLAVQAAMSPSRPKVLKDVTDTGGIPGNPVEVVG